MQYQDMTKKEMQREYHRLCQRYHEYEQQGLQLDLSRGKPAPEQLALSQRMLGELNSRSVLDSEDGTDCRNYGEAKALLAGMIGARPEQVMVGGNSSLTMMFDILSHAMLDGLLGAEPWVQVKDRKFLCPVPGYDRHFAMTEHFGFQLIPIPMHNDGPDMDMIEDLVQRDASIKGIWCVPKYQNPTGIVFSPMVVERFAHLQPAAPDFRIFWDNAYCVHDLYPNAPAVLPDILSACANAGHPDMVYEFCSTSKVSFPGAGISGVAASSANLIDLRKVWKFATIGPDKLNQLRQARFFRNESGIEAHMARHARLLRPKFERITGQRLHAGMKVLLRVRAQFHAAYGFSWIVSDINPEYTMGDLARRRQEIVRQLKAEGVFDLQKELQLPMFAQRIAVISSEGAAGYGDFCRQLHDNQAGYIYKVELFGAVMQGEAVEQSVIAALGRIYERVDDFDAVVIIRGGGATSDMSGFDTLALAENVANFPLPIITGIGHERDECVLDMVAFARMKTPTAAAQHLIDNLQLTDQLINQLADRIADRVKRRMDVERVRLASMAERIPMLFSLVKTKEWGRADRLMQRIATAVSRRLATAETRLDTLQRTVETASKRKIDTERHRLELLAQRIEAENPERLLRRGYSITTYNGKAVRDAAQLPKGALVETHVEKGKFKSRVE